MLLIAISSSFFVVVKALLRLISQKFTMASVKTTFCSFDLGRRHLRRRPRAKNPLMQGPERVRPSGDASENHLSVGWARARSAVSSAMFVRRSPPPPPGTAKTRTTGSGAKSCCFYSAACARLLPRGLSGVNWPPGLYPPRRAEENVRESNHRQPIPLRDTQGPQVEVERGRGRDRRTILAVNVF